jgi:hypothetical protein
MSHVWRGWVAVLAVKSGGEPLQRDVMNSTTVEHLFLSDNQLPVCSYVFVKQQAKQKKSLDEKQTNKQTNKQTSPSNPLTSRSQ